MKISEKQFLTLITILSDSLKVKDDSTFTIPINDRTKLATELVAQQDNDVIIGEHKYKSIRYCAMLYDSRKSVVTKSEMMGLLESSNLFRSSIYGGIFNPLISEKSCSPEQSQNPFIINSYEWAGEVLFGHIVFLSKNIENMYIDKDKSPEADEIFVPRIIIEDDKPKLITFDIKID